MKQYIVDAFTDKPFSGNPAAVCVMKSWPSEGSMMKLAMENNLSETAFIVKEPKRLQYEGSCSDPAPYTRMESSGFILLWFAESPDRCHRIKTYRKCQGGHFDP